MVCSGSAGDWCAGLAPAARHSAGRECGGTSVGNRVRLLQPWGVNTSWVRGPLPAFSGVRCCVKLATLVTTNFSLRDDMSKRSEVNAGGHVLPNWPTSHWVAAGSAEAVCSERELLALRRNSSARASQTLRSSGRKSNPFTATPPLVEMKTQAFWVFGGVGVRKRSESQATGSTRAIARSTKSQTVRECVPRSCGQVHWVWRVATRSSLLDDGSSWLRV